MEINWWFQRELRRVNILCNYQYKIVTFIGDGQVATWVIVK